MLDLSSVHERMHRDEPLGQASQSMGNGQAKRLLDFALSSLMLIASAPVFLVVPLLIKLEDGGTVFFTQQRWGRGGKIFTVWKFRTMRPQAGTGPAIENDRRITKIGGFLRRTGLDELPQLAAIFKGEMSFVGPRPLAVGEIVKDRHGKVLRYEDTPGFERRLSALPGLTGLATVYIPKDSHPRRKFRYDLLYVRKQSLGLDIKLIALSFLISFGGKWEVPAGRQGEEPLRLPANSETAWQGRNGRARVDS